MTSITIFNETEEKIIGVCSTHRDPCGGLNRLPSHQMVRWLFVFISVFVFWIPAGINIWPKWSNGAASLKTFVSFVSHLNRILTVIRHLVNVIAGFILKFQPQSKQSVRPTIKIEWNLNTIPENLNPSDIAAFEICRLSLHLPGVILCVRRKNFSRSTFGRRDQATFESWCHLS